MNFGTFFWFAVSCRYFTFLFFSGEHIWTQLIRELKSVSRTEYLIRKVQGVVVVMMTAVVAVLSVMLTTSIIFNSAFYLIRNVMDKNDVSNFLSF